jgi:UDP-2,3-diacylglucosamine pyrophosphatase LpxH
MWSLKMNRKSFLKNITLGSASIIFPWDNFSFSKSVTSADLDLDDWLNVEHSFDNYNTVIKCNDIKEKMRLFHISDSHLSILDNGKSELPEFTARMDAAYKDPKHYLTDIAGTKEKHFEGILEEAKKKNVNLILLTGDIINNPTIANVQYIKARLNECGIEYIYTAGNHDWHFEGMEGSSHTLRSKWVSERLKPLYNGENPLFSSKIVQGVNFISIDNSTYQVSSEQVEFFRDQSSNNLPIVLCMHIPVYQPLALTRNSASTIGDPRWGAAIDKNYVTEKRERWPESGNLKSTYEFLIELFACRKLLAVFAGHVHTARQSRISVSAYQYITTASLSGAYRFVELTS